jgi:predicted ATPase/DNA-binding winged helix-turn-helix (wHTH) protein
MMLRFEDFELDPVAYELRRNGERIRLARQPMDLLLLLLERPQELVSRDEIATRLWGQDVFVDLDAGIHTAVLRIRQALGDSRELPRFVETVAGKGYRFVAAIEVVPSSHRQASHALPAGSDTRRHNLPTDLTSFIGRHKELLHLSRLPASSRLVTLTGAGGVGKTRLAVRLAFTLLDQFPDGVWFADFAPLSAPDLMTQTIATAVGIREAPRRSLRESLLDKLRDRELLLVLDNCEHLIAPCAELVETLLRGAPALRIVVTSREALAVSGEIVCRVPSLTLPAALTPLSVTALADSEATQLFIERATATDPSFSTTDRNAAAIVRICQRLDGIPLAIELAAARVAVLTPEQIEARLDDRFRLLTGGMRTAVARQRTLEAAVDWSYQLLSDVERELFARLSVFPAGWTLEAAEKICAGDGINSSEVLDLLSRLAAKSLVGSEGDFDGERRYRFLETVRQYARERLMRPGALDRMRQRHFEYFFDKFRGSENVLRSHSQVAHLRHLEVERENVRAALEWGITSSVVAAQALDLAAALFWFWSKRGLFEEGTQWIERALAAAIHAPMPLRARGLIGLAHIRFCQGTYSEATVAEALSLGRRHDDPWVVAFALFLQALASLERGDGEEAVSRAVEAREAANASGDAWQHGGPLLTLANIAFANGEHDRAQQLYDDSIEVHRRVGDAWGLAIVLSTSAGLCLVREGLDQAGARAAEALSLCHELEDERGIAWSLDVYAGVLAAGGDARGAARLWGASDELLKSNGGYLPPALRWIRDRYVEPAKILLGSDEFEAERSEGRVMPFEQAIAFARNQARLVH